MKNTTQNTEQDQRFFSIFGNKISKEMMDKLLSYQYENTASEEFTLKNQNNE